MAQQFCVGKKQDITCRLRQSLGVQKPNSLIAESVLYLIIISIMRKYLQQENVCQISSWKKIYQKVQYQKQGAATVPTCVPVVQ